MKPPYGSQNGNFEEYIRLGSSYADTDDERR